MRFRHLCVTFFIFLGSLSVFSQTDGVGVGIIVGEPTGVSIKSWQSPTRALDIGIAWSFADEDDFHVHADYLWHNFSVFAPKKGQMPFYYGVGGRVKFTSKTRVGIRGVLGIAYIFPNEPFDIFLEVAPLFDFVPDTDFTFNAAIGFRFFF